MGAPSFSFDERALRDVIDSGMQGVTVSYQRLFDELRADYTGRPVEEIKPVLQARWRSVAGGEITDPQLSEWAQHIADGTDVQFRYER